jgi:hypothetical protein
LQQVARTPDEAVITPSLPSAWLAAPAAGAPSDFTKLGTNEADNRRF